MWFPLQIRKIIFEGVARIDVPWVISSVISIFSGLAKWVWLCSLHIHPLCFSRFFDGTLSIDSFYLAQLPLWLDPVCIHIFFVCFLYDYWSYLIFFYPNPLLLVKDQNIGHEGSIGSQIYEPSTEMSTLIF